MSPNEFFSRICVFIDNSNMINTLREITGPLSSVGATKMDYGRLMDFLQKRINGIFCRPLVIDSVFLYDNIATNNPEKAQMKNYCINKIKEKIIAKDIKFCEKLFPIELGGFKRVKGVDIEIALDIYSKVIERKIDIVVLISGDGDFSPLVKKVKEELRIPMIVAFFDASLSGNLKSTASYFINLEIERIKQFPVKYYNQSIL